MGAKFSLKVVTQENKPVPGVSITGTNLNAWAASGKYWYGTTDESGVYTWENIDTGASGDKYYFVCRYIDNIGTEWKGEASERITPNFPAAKVVTLRKKFLDEEIDFSLPPEIESNIEKTPAGVELIAAFREMNLAIKQGMSHSAIALSTYIVEGLIIMKAKKEGIWKEEWNRSSYGELINEKEIRKILPPEILDRAIALNHLRIPGVHFKGASTFIEDAKSGIHVILFLASRWFRPAATKPDNTKKADSENNEG